MRSISAWALYSQLRTGVIDIEAGKWQLIAIASRRGAWSATNNRLEFNAATAKVKEYVVDQLEDVYGAGCVTVCKAYPGDVDAYRSFVPGSTPAGSVHNFPLMYQEEDGSWEPVGFWLKSNHGSAMQLRFTEWRD